MFVSCSCLYLSAPLACPLSPFAFHLSPFTWHLSPVTPHPPPLTSHPSRQMLAWSLLLFTSFCLPLIIDCRQIYLIIECALLVMRYPSARVSSFIVHPRAGSDPGFSRPSTLSCAHVFRLLLTNDLLWIAGPTDVLESLFLLTFFSYSLA